MLPKGGMTKMIKKAQELQDQMEKAQEEITLIYTGQGLEEVAGLIQDF